MEFFITHPGVTLASIYVGVAAVLGIVTPVWVAIILGLVALIVSGAALVIAIRSDATATANNTVLAQLKAEFSSKANEVEAKLKHGT